MTPKTSRIIRRAGLTALLVALLASLAGNAVLYRHAMDTYTETQRLRLDPTYGKVFEPANASLAPTPLGQRRVVLFGDSRISMWNPPPRVEGCQIVNRGVGGETTDQMLLRIDRDVLALKPDAVVLELGINDLKTLGVFPDRGGEIINSCRRNADLILKRLRRAKIEVILLTILPPARPPLVRRVVWSDAATRAAVEDFNRRMLARHDPGLTVVDCDPAMADDGPRLRSEYVLDTLHLNPAGYAALNRLVEPVIAGRSTGGSSTTQPK